MSVANHRSTSDAAFKTSLLTALIVGLVGSLIFLLQLNPWANWRDGAEFIGVASSLGIAHPTGYPIYSLGGRLAVLFAGWLISPVTSANLLSALAAGGTCALMTAISTRLFLMLQLGPLPRVIKIVAALLPPIILAGMGVFVDQAIVAEVYTIHTLFAGLLILCGLISVQQVEYPRYIPDGRIQAGGGWWGLPGGWRYPILMAYLAGLALGNHVTIILYYPALAILLFWTPYPGHRPPVAGNEGEEGWTVLRIVMPLLLFLVLGVSVYLLLPLRAGLRPPYDWGGASTLRNFLRLITAAEIRARPGTYEPITPLNIWARIAADTGWIVLILSLLGWLLAGIRNRRLGLISFVYLLVPLAFLLVGLDIIDDALLPFHLWIVLGSALTGVIVAERLVAVLGPLWGRNLALAGMGLFLVIGPGRRIAEDWGKHTQPAAGGAETYTRAVIASVAGEPEPDQTVRGLVFCEDNATAFMLWEFDRRRNEYPDLHGIYLLLAREQWYQEQLRRSVPGLVVPALDRAYERMPHSVAAVELVKANLDQGRPLFLSPVELPPEQVYGVLVPQGVLFRIEAPGYQPTEQDLRRHAAIMDAWAPAFQLGELQNLDPQSRDGWSWKHLQLGRAWLRLGLILAARNEFQAAVRTAPERIETWLDLAEFYAEIGDRSEAVAVLWKANELEPHNRQVRLELARALSLQGEYAAADSLLPRGRLGTIDRVEYLKTRAGIRMGLADMNSAQSDLEAAARLDPNDGEIWNDLGYVYVQLEHWAQASSSFERAVELSPDLGEAWVNLGMIATQDSRWEDAARYFRRAIEAGAHRPEIGQTLGLVLLNGGDARGAEEVLRDNLRVWPDHADTYLTLGYLLEKQGRIRDAIDVYTAGRSAIPGDDRIADRLRRLQLPPA